MDLAGNYQTRKIFTECIGLKVAKFTRARGTFVSLDFGEVVRVDAKLHRNGRWIHRPVHQFSTLFWCDWQFDIHGVCLHAMPAWDYEMERWGKRLEGRRLINCQMGHDTSPLILQFDGAMNFRVLKDVEFNEWHVSKHGVFKRSDIYSKLTTRSS